MEKVICDVCGTTYPDTSEQCPICGSANRTKTPTKAGATDEKKTTAAGYATKGGRFSKSNVRKRNQTGGAGQAKRTEQPKEEEQNNTGLIVAVVLLLLAIIVVLIYIGVRYFSQSNIPDLTDPPSIVETGDPTDGTPPNEEHRVPCQSVVLSNSSIKLSENNRSMRLVVQITPADSTDTLTFESSDESVATVSADGVVTAVGNGEAIITAKCGDQVATCVVSCKLPVETDPTAPTEFDWILEWNTIFFSNNIPEVSLMHQGETWRCYKYSMNVAASEVTWWSDNEDVCVVKNGIVTAVNYGVTRVYAQFNGETYYAVVRCTFRVQPPTEPTEPDVTEPDVTEPDVTEPDVTEPEETDPIESDPVETDPVESDPVASDPVESDPVETDPEQSDPEST